MAKEAQASAVTPEAHQNRDGAQQQENPQSAELANAESHGTAEEVQRLSDEMRVRRSVVEKLRAQGIVPYAERFPVSHLSTEARTLQDGAEVAIAGRIRLWRSFGKLIFGTLQDRAGTVQFSFRKETLGEKLPWLEEHLFVGDFIGIQGQMWTTKKGERTVDAQQVQILSKAVRPLPDKWHGLTDTEAKYRQRYLDLLANEETRARFRTRSRIISLIRAFLDRHDFLEVETPMLQAAASGAAARPFETYHNALDRHFYLRISPETYLKRLVAGGLDRVYEIGRNFRNEGIDPSHLQEFTMLEWYAAYWSYQDNIRFVRELIQHVIQEVCGTLTLSYQGTTIDFSGEWPEYDIRTLITERSGIDVRQVTEVETLKKQIRERGIEIENLDAAVSYGNLVDMLYKKTVRPYLIQPCIVAKQPAEMVPLARRSDQDPSSLDMFQVVVNSWEIVKAYSELVDPELQRATLEDQLRLRQAGDEETMMLEEDFIEAMEFGMPPMSGLGLGIDRFIALVTDQPSLRDVVFFPQMRER